MCILICAFIRNWMINHFEICSVVGSVITISSKCGMCQVLLSRSHINLTLSTFGSNVEESVTTTIYINHLLCASSIPVWPNQIQQKLHNVQYEHMGKILILAAPEMQQIQW